MKKVIMYIVFVILLCFFIPVIFTNKKETIGTISTNNIEDNNLINNQVALENSDLKNNQSTSEDNNLSNTQVTLENYDYENYKTIKLLHTKTGEIEEINLDEYLCGVISAEMPASYELEALKAQAVVARTYTLYKMINAKPHGEEADICDSFQCCQAWISKEDRFAKWAEGTQEANWNKIVTAVNETKGKVITYDGKIINAFFHANSGGKTEVPVNVWGGTGYPYLQVVETSGEEGYTQYSSVVELTVEEFINKFKEKYADISIDMNNLEEEIKIQEYTESGRVKTLKVGNKNIAGTEVRTILGLRSTNFNMELDVQNSKVKFDVTGYGHGVGMSQTGADAMAKQGSTYEQIVKHFYVGVEIVDI